MQTKCGCSKTIFILFASLVIINIFAVVSGYKLLTQKDKEINSLKENIKQKQKWNENLSDIILERDQMLLKTTNESMEVNNKNEELSNILKNINQFNESLDNAKEFKVTSYDLSIDSCAKTQNDPEYGITKLGYNLIRQSWNSARMIATDPSIIPSGSVVYICFTDEKFRKYDGLYYSGDTGSGIKGYIIDFFFGDFNSSEPDKEVLDFGVQKAKIILLQKG